VENKTTIKTLVQLREAELEAISKASELHVARSKTILARSLPFSRFLERRACTPEFEACGFLYTGQLCRLVDESEVKGSKEGNHSTPLHSILLKRSWGKS